MEMLAHDLAELRRDLWSAPRINGYYAFEYFADNRSQSPTTFRQHSLNVFIGRNWDHWRILTEVEFEDGPAFEGTPAGVEGNGSIKMEYGWFEYRRDDRLTVRGGKFLLPQYWNVNHYAPVVLSTTRPLMTRAVFPADTVGLMLHGNVFPGAVGGSYSVYYGNGQSGAATDDNENKGVGGRLTAHLGGLMRSLSRLDVSASYHTERADALGGGYDALGGDVQIVGTRFELLGEYATVECNPDLEGFYVQPSARLFGDVRAFYRYDYLDDGTNPETAHTLGLNWRPTSNVSLKVEGAGHDFGNPGKEAFDLLAASVALFF